MAAPDDFPEPVTPKRTRFLFGSIDDYEQLEELDDGTFGVVHKARDRRTGEEVAIKCLQYGVPDGEVIREATCQAACRGIPGIVQMMDVAEDAETGDKFLVMELVAGGNLRDHLRRGRRRGRPEEATRDMMRSLVGAAAKMHDAGIIHRDLKPENVLLCGPSGGLKICDFGSATPAKPTGGPYEEGAVGTPIYNSPELIAGSKYYGAAVDMWALGCIMFELVAGDTLFDEEDDDDEDEDHLSLVSLRDKVAEHGSSAFEGLPELSVAGREILAGLLALNPDERLTAAAALKHRWFREKAEPTSMLLPGLVALPPPPKTLLTIES